MNYDIKNYAYLGDAVYELYIREHLINKGICKVNDLQNESLKYVSAKSQSSHLDRLINSGFLLFKIALYKYLHDIQFKQCFLCNSFLFR